MIFDLYFFLFVLYYYVSHPWDKSRGVGPRKGGSQDRFQRTHTLIFTGMQMSFKKLSIWLYKSPKAQWKRSGDDVQGPPTRRRGWGDEDTPPEAEGGAAVAWEPPRYLG